MRHKKAFPVCLALLSAVTALPAYSAELALGRTDNALLLQVSQIRYPTNLVKKELKSGLPNDISLVMSIVQQDTAIYSGTANYKITYDLWDEVFSVESQNIDGEKHQIQIAEGEIADYVQHFTLTSKHVIPRLKANQAYQFQVRILVNPVKTERINKIKTWIANSQGHKVDEDANNSSLIAANTTPTARVSNPAAQGNRTSAGQATIGSARPRFQKLFDQILEQYITEDEIPALWSSEVFSIKFNLEQLPNATQDHQ